MEAYNVLIVDDHLVVREGLKLILETNDKFQVIGEAENGSQALDILKAKKPDVILMDLNMPVLNGLDTITKLNELNVRIPIIILTTYNEDEWMIKGLELGAKGYLLKDTSRDNLFRSIETAVRGETLLQPEILERVLKAKTAIEVSLSNNATNLTEKELFILKAAAKGY